MTDQEINDLKQFSELKVQAKAIKEKLELLKPRVRTVLTRVHAEDTPVVSEVGKLSLRPRRTWLYSDELEATMKKVSADQKLEQATGKATFETQYDVYFK